MEVILEWLNTYSWPVVILLILGMIGLYSVRHFLEKCIESGLDRQATRLEISLQRRSDFEQTVLLERYTVALTIARQLNEVETQLRHVRGGHDIEEGFYRPGHSGTEIVPLTIAFNEIEANRPIFPESLHSLLLNWARAVVEMANADTDSISNCTQLSVDRRNAFVDEFRDHFEINDISPSHNVHERSRSEPQLS